ncbi:DUF503 family protein [Hydrogenimonas sp.]
MTLTYADLTIDLPHVQSKKGRRALLNSLKERLKAMNCSVLDLSGEYPKTAHIALAFLSATEADAHARLEKIERLLAERYSELETTLDYEFL